MSNGQYQVAVTQEGAYWVAEVSGVQGAVVETRRLDHLEGEVRDGLALLLAVAHDSFDLNWSYDLPADIANAVERYRRASTRLAEAEREYADVSRRAVRDLERAHISRRNAAALLGVSHQRVQQLAADAKHKLVDA